MSFKVKFQTGKRITVKFGSDLDMKAKFSQYIEVPVADYYDGEYAITPSDTAQIIPIVGKTARQNITVGAIPQNYGLITWNGSVLTVS